jgi:RNA polymerase sigma-70 factor (ECF subfamily)
MVARPRGGGDKGWSVHPSRRRQRGRRLDFPFCATISFVDRTVGPQPGVATTDEFRKAAATVTVTPFDNQTDAVMAMRFQREVSVHSHDLYWNARRLTRDHADAEDLVQETLLYAYRGFAGFQAGTNLWAWLFRIMRNRWISGHRRSERRLKESLEADIDDRVTGTSAALATAQRSAEEEFLSRVPDMCLEAALATLPEGSRIALYYAAEGYSHQEIASRMDIPVGTVMSRIFRARRRVRDLLQSAHHQGFVPAHVAPCPSTPKAAATRASTTQTDIDHGRR